MLLRELGEDFVKSFNEVGRGFKGLNLKWDNGIKGANVYSTILVDMLLRNQGKRVVNLFEALNMPHLEDFVNVGLVIGPKNFKRIEYLQLAGQIRKREITLDRSLLISLSGMKVDGELNLFLGDAEIYRVPFLGINDGRYFNYEDGFEFDVPYAKGYMRCADPGLFGVRMRDLNVGGRVYREIEADFEDFFQRDGRIIVGN